jgi:hypothetical protein
MATDLFRPQIYSGYLQNKSSAQVACRQPCKAGGIAVVGVSQGVSGVAADLLWQMRAVYSGKL